MSSLLSINTNLTSRRYIILKTSCEHKNIRAAENVYGLSEKIITKGIFSRGCKIYFCCI